MDDSFWREEVCIVPIDMNKKRQGVVIAKFPKPPPLENTMGGGPLFRSYPIPSSMCNCMRVLCGVGRWYEITT